MQILEDGDKTGKPKKLETKRIGPGKWQETLKNVHNEKHILWELVYGNKTEKRGK